MSEPTQEHAEELHPWEVLEEREVFRLDPWLVLHLQKIRLPNGSIVEDYCKLDVPRFVIIVAFTKENEIIMLRQYRHGLGQVSLTLPGGMMDREGESTLDCAKRELLEETGYDAPTWKSLGSYIPHSNYGCGEGEFFMATGAVKVRTADSGDLEEQVVELVSEDAAIEALRTNRIISMSNAAALAMALNPNLQ